MQIDVIGGFLGSGKTTAILGMLEQQAVDPARTVLLVNEFGEVGVDGSLLSGKGGMVAELPSGCICCSLRADFMQQLQDIARDIGPERVVIEPSGVASLRDILQSIHSEPLASVIDDVRTVLILDADDYEWFTELSETFVEAQIGLAQLILINKTDLAEEETVAGVAADLQRRNPLAVILPTTYGRFSWEDVEPLLAPVSSVEGPSAALDGYQVFAREVEVPCREAELQALFRDIKGGRFGSVVRAKGVFRAEEGCVRLDLASGRLHTVPWPCSGAGRVNVIGEDLDTEGLEEALAGFGADGGDGDAH